jgi:hypothetical protein
VRLTYELKGDCERKALATCDNVVLKEGNLPLVDNQRRLPQVVMYREHISSNVVMYVS